MKNKTHDPAAQQDQALRKERPGVEAPVAGGTRVRPLRLRPAVRGAPPEMGARRLAVAGGNRCRAAADASGGACARPAGLVEAVLTVDGSAVTRAKAEAAVSRLRTQTTQTKGTGKRPTRMSSSFRGALPGVGVGSGGLGSHTTQTARCLLAEESRTGSREGCSRRPPTLRLGPRRLWV